MNQKLSVLGIDQTPRIFLQGKQTINKNISSMSEVVNIMKNNKTNKKTRKLG